MESQDTENTEELATNLQWIDWEEGDDPENPDELADPEEVALFKKD